MSVLLFFGFRLLRSGRRNLNISILIHIGPIEIGIEQIANHIHRIGGFVAILNHNHNGNLGIMDYYKMKNVMADTAMREAISKPVDKK